jgi:hypothetical protein
VSTVWIVVQERFKVRPATPPVTLAPADGAILATDPLVATPYHRGRTSHWTVFKPCANVGTLVPVKTNPEHLVRMVRTPTTRVPSPAFPVRRVHLPAKRPVPNATNVPRGIYNRIQHNQHVFK